MSQKLPKEIELAIEKAIDEFVEDEEVILRDENETRKYKYKGIFSLKNWNKTQICIIKGCKNKSIAKSHTIQKSASIMAISENGHLLTPSFDDKIGKIILKPIGVNEASTFPGYCDQHENIFKGFESIKDIQTMKHLSLQLYRTICREIVAAQYEIKLETNHIENYKALRSIKISRIIEQKLKGKYTDIDKINFKSFVFKGQDKRLTNSNKQLLERKAHLNDCLLKLHDAILNDIKKNKFQKLAYEFIEFPEVIPVALAGKGSFTMKLENKAKKVDIIFNVLPFSNRTYVFVASVKKYKKELEAYMSNCNSGLQLINKVESWMIFNSTHWFIKPSVWENISESDKLEILESIGGGGNQDKYGKFNKTIFNEIKLKIIKIIEAKSSKLELSHQEFILKEKNKITFANNKYM